MFDAEQHVIPLGLDAMEPGPFLATILSTIDPQRLSGRDRVVVLRAHHRLAAHHAARVYEAMAAVSDATHEREDDHQLAHESAAAEIGSALRLTRRAADHELNLALTLRRRLPAVHRLLSEGLIDGRRARVIADSTSHLSVGAARRVVATIVDDAPSLTTGQIGARLRRACLDHDAETAQDRYHHAAKQRRIVTEPTVDGTAHVFGLDLPPDRVQEASDRINELARALRHSGETRTMDQLRADVFLDLLTGTRGTRAGTVDIQVDLETLTRLSQSGADLAGYGPVVADIARQVAEQSPSGEWRFRITDDETGTVHSGTTRRRPTRGQRRRVESRDATCVFPGCRMPARQSDLDHGTRLVDGGRTSENNLAPLCRHHHRIKESGWSYRRLENGTYAWTSRLGNTYIASGGPRKRCPAGLGFANKDVEVYVCHPGSSALHGPTGWNEWVGPVGRGPLEPFAYDKPVMERLWELSEKQTGYTWGFPH